MSAVIAKSAAIGSIATFAVIALLLYLAPDEGQSDSNWRGVEMMMAFIITIVLGLVCVVIFLVSGRTLARTAYPSFMRACLVVITAPLLVSLLPLAFWLSVTNKQLGRIDTYVPWLLFALVAGLLLVPGALLQVAYLRRCREIQRS